MVIGSRASTKNFFSLSSVTTFRPVVSEGRVADIFTPYPGIAIEVERIADYQTKDHLAKNLKPAREPVLIAFFIGNALSLAIRLARSFRKSSIKPIMPSQIVLKSMSRIYALCRLASRRVGIRMARIMIKPPMVGVPFFCCSPASPRSRTVSPI